MLSQLTASLAAPYARSWPGSCRHALLPSVDSNIIDVRELLSEFSFTTQLTASLA